MDNKAITLKSVFDIITGFPIIGFFTGFWTQLSAAEIIAIKTAIITLVVQTLLIVFKEMFVTWWRKRQQAKVIGDDDV
ncbi:MAG: hypothetical protein HUU10_15135 [Bacteroidetes bacterium]|nr:hypothetical protein [Bacteroidota bacterium]